MRPIGVVSKKDWGVWSLLRSRLWCSFLAAPMFPMASVKEEIIIRIPARRIYRSGNRRKDNGEEDINVACKSNGIFYQIFRICPECRDCKKSSIKWAIQKGSMFSYNRKCANQLQIWMRMNVTFGNTEGNWARINQQLLLFNVVIELAILTLCKAQCCIHPHPHINIFLSLIHWSIIGPLAEPDVCTNGSSALAAIQETNKQWQQGSHSLDILQVHFGFHLIGSDSTVKRITSV